MMASDDHGPAVYCVAWIFGILSFAVVSARIWIRTKVIHKIRIDDYIIIFTLLLVFGNAIFLTISTHYGLGKHVQDLQSTPQNINIAIKYVYLCEFFSIMAPCFGRISFALMLLSLVPPTNLRRRILQVIIAVALTVDLGAVIISFAQCRPIEAFWDGRDNPDCWDGNVQKYTGFFQGSVGAVIDLILACFPMSLFWNLNMAWKQKASLSSIMGLGIFAMVASIIKTIELQALTATEDLTFEMAKLTIWWTLEANLVLIAVSIPTLKPILKPKGSTSTSLGAPNSNAYSSWRRGPTSSNKETHEQFDHIPEPSCASSTENILQVANNGVFQMNEIHIARRKNSQGDLDGIRKDITVSVSYSPK